MPRSVPSALVFVRRLVKHLLPGYQVRAIETSVTREHLTTNPCFPNPVVILNTSKYAPKFTMGYSVMYGVSLLQIVMIFVMRFFVNRDIARDLSLENESPEVHQFDEKDEESPEDSKAVSAAAVVPIANPTELVVGI